MKGMCELEMFVFDTTTQRPVSRVRMLVTGRRFFDACSFSTAAIYPSDNYSPRKKCYRGYYFCLLGKLDTMDYYLSTLMIRRTYLKVNRWLTAIDSVC